MTLNNVENNNCVTIASLVGGYSALRDLGFCEKLKITKLHGGKNIICILCGAKIAISKDLAEYVIVENKPID